MDLLTTFFGVSFADIVDAFKWAAKVVGGTGSVWFVASAGRWFVRKRDDSQPDNPTTHD